MRRELLTGKDQLVADFVARLSPLEEPIWGAGYIGLGILRDDGALIGGVVFSSYRPKFQTIEFSAALVIPFGPSPQIVRAIGEYVFGQLTVNRLWARTSVKNRRACKILEHLGFTQESVSADHYGPGRHAMTFRLLKRDWLQRQALQEAA